MIKGKFRDDIKYHLHTIWGYGFPILLILSPILIGWFAINYWETLTCKIVLAVLTVSTFAIFLIRRQ